MKTKFFIAVLILIFAVIIAGFYWQTLYRYEKITKGGDTYPLRINRLNGKTDIFMLGVGWDSYEDEDELEEAMLPPDESSKVAGKASLGGLFEWKLYNGSSWQIRKAFITININEKDGNTRWERKYEVHPEYGPISPLTTGTLRCIVSDSDDRGDWGWRLVEIWGVRVK